MTPKNILTEAGWKAILTKNKIRDNGLPKALSACDKLDRDAHYGLQGADVLYDSESDVVCKGKLGVPSHSHLLLATRLPGGKQSSRSRSN